MDLWSRLTPQRLLAASVAVALATIVLKTAAWWITDSVGLLSDALESIVNLAGATFGLWMVTLAAQPADAEHPYGHHKAEYFSAGFEGLLIIAAALGIGWAALHRLLQPQPLQRLDWGLGLSVLSSALNGVLAAVMLRAARVHRSQALEGDARHLLTDVWTSAGVIVGLMLVAATGWGWLDPMVALLVAANIAREGGRLVWQASQGLMDRAVEPQVRAAIEAVLADFLQRAQAEGALLRFDHLHTRQAGQRCYVDVHLHAPPQWTLRRAAELRQQVEQALMEAVPGVRATIQVLPNDTETVFDAACPPPGRPSLG
ncbi:Ferrous-iron efflux pump FieF [Tepidimonas alkaliphilus]|uniref:Ferrous-iron efflux pump FieF n=1 Tax=Tepidimonas alkaliphilus TaxID=2588942 RepID=A0A554W9A4_9BURK|nr:cation diffusion facilitator family transporter [Tepidimonas alkaliphilus]TSE20146.1 Ferrous-iron efflux pump FieF [Tepidimonas alkaliphilus]